jgi:D-serine dehydratase
MPATEPPIESLLDPLLGPHHKGWPAQAPPLRRSQVGAQGWQVLRGDTGFPLAVIKQSALNHNLGWMQRFCEARDIQLAPHGKTSLSPQLFQRQLHTGAWGMTVANLAQLHVALAAGATRAIIANQVLHPADVRALVALRQAQPGLRVLFLLDSLAQLEQLEAARPALPLEVLLELGLAGARTGCRTHEQALAATSALMARLQAVAQACEAQGLFETAAPGDALLFTAGGSAIYDLVAPGLRVALNRPTLGLLRSGCYLTHDHGNYRRYARAVNQRIGCTEAQGLQAAMEVWCLVQSVPEPGLALLTAGRRDVSYDIELPVPAQWCARSEHTARPVPQGWHIKALNDQHAYLVCPGAEPQVGDRVALGISHPCTTFDKWRWMAVVDDTYRVVDAITTAF